VRGSYEYRLDYDGRGNGIGPGSGNHWSDEFRGQYGDYFLMSNARFEAKYGLSMGDYRESLILDRAAKSGELTEAWLAEMSSKFFETGNKYKWYQLIEGGTVRSVNQNGGDSNILDRLFSYLPGELDKGTNTVVSVGTNYNIGIKGIGRVAFNPISEVLTQKDFTNKGNKKFSRSSNDGTVRLHQEFGFSAAVTINYTNFWETSSELGHLNGMYKSDQHSLEFSVFGVGIRYNWGSEENSFFYGFNYGISGGVGIGGAIQTYHGNTIKF
jgi:hypothetical protein